MKYREYISISGLRTGFSLDAFVQEVENQFGKFERLGSVMRRDRICDVYKEDDLIAITRMIEERGLMFNTERLEGLSVYGGAEPIYTPEELESVPLFECGIPKFGDKQAWVKGVKCADCGAELYNNPKTVSAVNVRASSDFGYCSQGVCIATAAGKLHFERAGLTGAAFKPVQSQGKQQLFVLAPLCELRHMVVRPTDAFGFTGYCTCGWPQMKKLFGPRRFRKSDWNGDDIVWTSHSAYVYYFSPRAIDVIQQIVPKAEKLDPVFLE